MSCSDAWKGRFRTYTCAAQDWYFISRNLADQVTLSKDQHAAL